jgi:transcriptional regulator with XRE-family HTH domain
MNPEWFAGRLRELREQAGVTQQQLADRAGLTREGVAQLETGRREPAWRTVLALCQALEVSCEAFAQPPGGDGSPRPPGRPPKRAPAAPATPAPPAKRQAGSKGRKARGK